MHPIVLLGDEAQVESRFGLFGYSVSIMQDMCTVCNKRNIGSEIVLHAPDDEAQVESYFGPFGDSVSISAR